MVLQDVYLSVPKPSSAFLINQTSFPTSFQFDHLRGNRNCDVTVNPSSGVLAPREEREIEVRKKLGDYVACTRPAISNLFKSLFFIKLEKKSLNYILNSVKVERNCLNLA